MNGYEKYNDIDLLLNEDKDVLDTKSKHWKGLIVAIYSICIKDLYL